MAVDTPAKRASAMNFGEFDLVMPIPSAGIDQGDRQHLCGIYSGILADPLVPPVAATVGILGRGRMPGILGRFN